MSIGDQVDILVIGSGPGGYAAAFRAADLGRDVLLIDRDSALGGVCLNRGCIPSKALLHISKVMEEASDVSKLGVTYRRPQIDLDAIRAHKEKIVSQLNGGIAQLAKARKVKTLQATVVFKSNNEVIAKTESEETIISFNKCIIATGSSSSMIPGIPKGHPSVLTSKTALDLTSIPEQLLVVGGGVIGLELGQVYSSLGSAVSVVEFLPSLIPGADEDLVKPLKRKFKKQFQSIMLSSKVVGVEPTEKDKLKVVIESGKKTKESIFDKF